MRVVVALGVGLRLEKTVADVGDEGISVLQESVHRGRARQRRLIWKESWWRTTVDVTPRVSAQ